MIVQVKPELFGGTNYRFPPARRGLLPLYAVEDDVTKMIPLDGVFLVEADGKKYEVRRPSPPPQLDSLDAAQKAAQDLF